MDNVLYVMTHGAALRRDHDAILVEVERENRLKVPFAQLEGVVIMAGVGVSPDLLGGLAQAGVFVSFFTSGGRFLARVEGMPNGNVLLRKAQVRASDSPTSTLELARAFVIGKIVGQRRQVGRAAREVSSEGDQGERLADAGKQLAVLARRALWAQDLDELRGIEGAAARAYFDVFSLMIKVEDEAFAFSGRSRRPPRDPVNAMLSFGYALLQRDCAGALVGIGLDPAIGFLHADRPGRLGLALDLMEELRVPVVDRLVLALINRRQISSADFKKQDGGAWQLTDEGRRSFLTAYQKAKQGQIRHHFLEQDATWGMIPHLQARLLARTLRGDLDAYPAFEFK